MSNAFNVLDNNALIQLFTLYGRACYIWKNEGALITVVYEAVPAAVFGVPPLQLHFFNKKAIEQDDRTIFSHHLYVLSHYIPPSPPRVVTACPSEHCFMDLHNRCSFILHYATQMSIEHVKLNQGVMDRIRYWLDVSFDSKQ